MKYCPECGSILDSKKQCYTCGYQIVLEEKMDPSNPFFSEEDLSEKKLLISHFDQIHTGFKSDQAILDKVNIDNINIANYVREIILKDNTTVCKKDNLFYCENEKCCVVIDCEDYSIIHCDGGI